MIIVSFCWPQVVPASARRMLIRGVAREMMELMWGVNVKWGSSVTPSMRGCLARGRGVLFRVTWGCEWDWCVSEVKRVTVDLGADRESPYASAYRETRET